MHHRSLRIVALVAVGFASQAAAQQAQPRPAPAPAPAAQATRVVVYKSASCGCCRGWVDHMRAAGFTVEVHDQDDVAPIKRASGVPTSLESCHTAQVGGYVIEGHVPAETIRRLLREKPDIVGLAAPGMPVGSPGMEVAGRQDHYDIVSFTRDGHTAVYERK